MIVGRKGPLRFKRADYHGATSTEPKWHRAKFNYKANEIYGSLEALCGYKLSRFKVLHGYDLSKAVKPRRGEICKKCEKAAETPAVTLVS